MIENQVKKKRRRIFLFSIIALLLVCGSVYAYISSALGPVDSGNKKEIEVEIPKGSSTSKIGEILEEKGAVKNGT
ncbi:hypothetical protein NYY93_23605, partial [Acinetobacter baumannii]|nr:hypothetical protein [Acinetobacter baumannii]